MKKITCPYCHGKDVKCIVCNGIGIVYHSVTDARGQSK